MKNKHLSGLLASLAALALLSTLNLQPSTAFAQGTAFTYQGRLNTTNGPASGTYNLTFSLFNTNTSGVAIAVPVTNNAVVITNGLFTVTIDFGPGVFTGQTNWLQIGVETNGASTFTTLAPRQQLTPTPYAIYAESANATNLSGTLPLAQLPGVVVTNNYAASVNLSGSFTGNGSGLTNVNAAALNGLNATSFWKTNGNAGTNPTNGAFLGTTDNQPLELKVNGQRAFRIVPTTDTPNLIGGCSNNVIAMNIVGATIGGGGTVLGTQPNIITNGGQYGTIAGGFNNTVTNYGGAVLGGSVNFAGGWFATIGAGQHHTNLGDFAFLGGGYQNSIQYYAYYSFLGGGYSNSIQTDANESVLGGGYGNSIQYYAYDSFLGGGYSNSIQTNAYSSVLGGGWGNSIQKNAYFSFLGGGTNNSIQANADHSVLGGGFQNSIQANASYSVLGGGWNNSIQTDAGASFLGGGAGNFIQPNAAYSVLGGGDNNVIETNAAFSFLGGGGANAIQPNADHSVLGGGVYNVIWADHSVLGGGTNNSIQTNAAYSFLGGGINNSIQPGANDSVLGGGYGNSIQTNASVSFLGGGYINSIQPGATASVLCGGYSNSIQTSATSSVLGGGGYNSIQTNASLSFLGGGKYNTNTGAYAVIPGGYQNMAGAYSFAAGSYARATNQSAFVWSDGSATTTSVSNNSVTMRATNGFRFFTGTKGSIIFTNVTGSGADQAVSWTPGSGSWSFTSDRTVKDRFVAVDAVTILDKIAQLPITEWSYQGYGQRHIGAMAQDFHALFPLNDNDKVLNDADLHGVELAAIQGLNQKLNEKDAEIQALKQSVAELKETLTQLTQKPN